ncbi:hypothetical protein EG68_07058 [Paragonimus skrjabini miyazakii]|uniref:Uncharacterized protein n=1 Tax=Paragonimus skrjabini miyazakii TaxID=59628 RepID=A0A8S9YMN6_9TREM|nr:hypothetical protein EG68_07058 [Paragonimus skrjabini miyazakii]
MNMPNGQGQSSMNSTYQLRTDIVERPNNSDLGTRTFQQRQSDVFASLANLEAAHVEVTRATKHERETVRKVAWRRTSSAVEDLVAEKERRVRNEINRSEETDDGGAGQPTFRKPVVPRFRRGTPHPRRSFRPTSIERDPSKWTHYSLADVDEDGFHTSGGDSNFNIASTFLSELRERRIASSHSDAEISPEDEDANEPKKRGSEHRILFRPVRGTKRTRREVEEPSASTVYTNPISMSMSTEVEDEVEPAAHTSSDSEPNVTLFVQRRQRRQLRDRISDQGSKTDVVTDEERETQDVQSDLEEEEDGVSSSSIGDIDEEVERVDVVDFLS